MDRTNHLRTRAAACVLGGGLVLAVVAMLGVRVSNLDSYIVPKELALHGSALLAVLLLTWNSQWSCTRIEGLLLLALLLSVASAWLKAVNPWWAFRALSLSWSGALLFWSAREVARRGHARTLLAVVAAALIVSAAIVLGEAQGVLPALSMPGRMPGGTGGNRNFTAHLLVLGIPLLALLTIRDAEKPGVVCWWLGLALLAAAILVSRSRGAWLGVLALVLTTAVSWAINACRRPPRGSLWVAAALLVGVFVASAPWPAMKWRSPTPFRDTLARLVESDRGTGRGRIIQYRTTLQLIAKNPMLGVAPGNWSVGYAAVSTGEDPSMEPGALRPVNRLPNGDWLGLASERGIPALLVLWASGALMAGWAVNRLRRGRFSGGAAEVALLACLGATLVMGAVDAVILRPEPTFCLALVLGGLLGEMPAREGRSLPRPAMPLAAVTFAITAAATMTSAAQGVSLLQRRRPDLASKQVSVRLDPGDYSLQAAVADATALAGDCDQARVYARQSRQYFPRVGGLTIVNRLCAPQTDSTASAAKEQATPSTRVP
jgi:hypothetical protein